MSPDAAEVRSPLEVDFLALCREEGLPPPVVNVLVAGHLVDFFWPRERVVVETDSYRYHADRLAFERDHQVDVDLIAVGYAVHRTTYRMLHRDPSPFFANVRRALQERTASTSQPAG
ncbi:MAG: DUF559 domain-containing protein [Solirubrobacterales bacterium]